MYRRLDLRHSLSLKDLRSDQEVLCNARPHYIRKDSQFEESFQGNPILKLMSIASVNELVKIGRALFFEFSPRNLTISAGLLHEDCPIQHFQSQISEIPHNLGILVLLL
jgi:hypothetical protein